MTIASTLFYYRPCSLLVLISFAGPEEPKKTPAAMDLSDDSVKRIYCIVPLSHDATTGTFSIEQNEKIVKIPFQSVSLGNGMLCP